MTSLAFASTLLALVAAPGLASAREDASMRASHDDFFAIPGDEAPSTDGDARSEFRPAVPHEDPVDALPTERHWYGWQTLVADGVSIGLTPAYGVGLAGYFLASPIVHMAHDRVGIGVASLGLRVGLPIALGWAGYQMENCPAHPNEEFCGLGGMVLGGLLGALSAIAIDASVLAWEDVPTTNASAARAKLPMVAVAPWIDHDRRGASIAMTF